MNIDLIFSEGCLACITAYLVYLCTETHYEKVNTDIRCVFFSQLSQIIPYAKFLFFYLQCIRKVSKYIGQQNERIYNPKGLQITDPTCRGLRVIEISILDRPGRT